MYMEVFIIIVIINIIMIIWAINETKSSGTNINLKNESLTKKTEKTNLSDTDTGEKLINQIHLNKLEEERLKRWKAD